MKQFTLTFTLVIFTRICHIFTDKILTEVVTTSKGPIQGEILPTVQNSAVLYSAFRGIPYAKPPISDLRFKPPVEVDGWREPLVATSDGNACPQLKPFSDQYRGNEDCLYLNIYTPKTMFNSITELLPVMVWIHGGSFSSGDNILGADFFMEENIVVVSVNYRLGPLGFLSLDHSNATGNAAMKDQVLALKWVRQNVHNFGGDPTKVTILGQSAGSVAVELHKISAMSRGLFDQSIAMSGAALNFWALTSTADAVSRAFSLGEHLGISTNVKEKLLEKLLEANPENLVRAAAKVGDQGSFGLPFTPTYENEEYAKNGSFLSECLVNRYRGGDFQDNPHVLGFTNAEAIAVALAFNKLKSGGIIDRVKILKIFDKILNKTLNHVPAIIDEGMRDVLTQIISDFAFISGIDRTQRYLSKKKSSVYYYRNSFDYNMSLHKFIGVDAKGTGHADDVLQIFWLPQFNQTLDPTSDIALQRKRMVRMWSNFVKYGNPTPNGTADALLNVEWTPSGQLGRHLEIGNNGYNMASRPTDFVVKLSQRIFKALERKFSGCS